MSGRNAAASSDCLKAVANGAYLVAHQAQHHPHALYRVMVVIRDENAILAVALRVWFLDYRRVARARSAQSAAARRIRCHARCPRCVPGCSRRVTPRVALPRVRPMPRPPCDALSEPSSWVNISKH